MITPGFKCKCSRRFLQTVVFLTSMRNKIVVVVIDFFDGLVEPIANQLREDTVNYPLTVMYLPLKWCGFAFKYFQRNLGDGQYYPPSADALPENRLFAQFYSPQTRAMKEILAELA